MLHFILYLLLLNRTQGTKKIQTKVKSNTNISKPASSSSSSSYANDKTRNVIRITQVGTKVWIVSKQQEVSSHRNVG